jgi:Cof subfamily protein (haloacid dehalogenase superfamily)
MSSPASRPDAPIRLLISDVDGTLINSDGKVTERTRLAVKRLKEAGIGFTFTSSRPPRGMLDFLRELEVTLPVAAFNGGTFFQPDLTLIEQHPLSDGCVKELIRLLEEGGVQVWLYGSFNWYVRDRHGPHVDHAAGSVRFEPLVLPSYDALPEEIVKVVGYCADTDRIAKRLERVRRQFGEEEVSASRSKPYYLDITHPQANKGAVVRWYGERLGIPKEQIASIGDGPNDKKMFEASGFGIAMGNAAEDVRKAARCVTTSNDDEGFANAAERYLL